MDVPDVRCSSAAGGEAKATPYASVLVTLSKQEHVELVWAASYWKIEHRRAAERALSIAAGYEERLRQGARNSLGVHGISSGKEQDALDDVAQLAHIPRP